MGFLATLALIIVVCILFRESSLTQNHNSRLKAMSIAENLIWYNKYEKGNTFTYYAPTDTKCQKFQDIDENHVTYYYFIDYKGNLLGGQYAWGDKRELSPNEIRLLKKKMNKSFNY